MSTVPMEKLCPDIWNNDSRIRTESSLHQISPYIGKMKPSMAKALIEAYSKPGDVVLDPFVGSGTVALECVIAGRSIIASDINPYSTIITKAKLNAPDTLEKALKKSDKYLSDLEKFSEDYSLDYVPEWVRSFFHPKTLREILVLVDRFKQNKEYFLLGCLLGILHHQRPGFLSFPASHLVPYLRSKKYPQHSFPEMYEYRAVAPRLKAKIGRTYKRFPKIDRTVFKQCVQKDIQNLSLKNHSIDTVITSPPYMNALDYARDNRLRLWFLGIDEYRNYDKYSNTLQKFTSLMGNCMSKINEVMKIGGKCVMVVGDLRRSNNNINTADVIVNLVNTRIIDFMHIDTVEDFIPDIRRSRRDARGTKREWILVFQKYR